jgi:hypothetical protein
VLLKPIALQKIFQQVGGIKKAATVVAAFFLETFFVDLTRCVAFPFHGRFAHSLREPFSPRSSEPIHRRLAIVLLRVCAPEVKKKFQKCKTKKRCTSEKYFAQGRCTDWGLFNAVKSRVAL